MDWGGPEFVIAIVAISTFGWLASTWIRAKHGYPVENEWSGTVQKRDPQAEREIGRLNEENEALRGEVKRLEERLVNLERIATDTPTRLARQIDDLRLGDQ